MAEIAASIVALPVIACSAGMRSQPPISPGLMFCALKLSSMGPGDTSWPSLSFTGNVREPVRLAVAMRSAPPCSESFSMVIRRGAVSYVMAPSTSGSGFPPIRRPRRVSAARTTGRCTVLISRSVSVAVPPKGVGMALIALSASARPGMSQRFRRTVNASARSWARSAPICTFARESAKRMSSS
ncbi:MAG: hypothetical protein BWY76_01745 [bacterium ADurb.Bin429]|nr:MAG: hypothetical protein BWY76_01745 [bacterium ADurb.Bin429]